MRSQSLSQMLQYEAKRSPFLQDLIARVDTLTFEEIKAAPTKLPWMRQALTEMKHVSNRAKLTVEIEDHVVDFRANDPEGIIRRWTGDDTFIRVDRGGEILIPSNRLIFFPDAGGMWFTTLFSKTIDPRLVQNTIPVHRGTRKSYSEQYQNELNGTYRADNLPVILDQSQSQTSSSPSRMALSALGVRIG